MSGRDGTGPMGRGAMTGGRRGWCAAANAAEGAPEAARGYGMGRGDRSRGNGWRHRRVWATGADGAVATPALAGDELTALRAQVMRIEQAMSTLLDRLENKETL